MTVKALQKIKFISDLLDKISAWVILPALCCLITLDVGLRYFFSSPISWSTEVNGILLLIFFMNAVPRCSESGGHVSLDLLYNRLGPRRRAFSNLVTAFAGLSLSAAMVYGSVIAFFRMIRTNDALIMVDLPKWPFAAFIGAISVFLVVQFFLQGIVQLRIMIAGKVA
jgi:TRAP-type C4-dicarboxylate transport system permease small subunit